MTVPVSVAVKKDSWRPFAAGNVETSEGDERATASVAYARARAGVNSPSPGWLPPGRTLDYSKKWNIYVCTPGEKGNDMTASPKSRPTGTWDVKKNATARKGEEKLPEKVRSACRAAQRALLVTGKARGFKNFGPVKQLGLNYLHCHLNPGHPTYVMVWKADEKTRSITIIYIGTHANAPY